MYMRCFCASARMVLLSGQRVWEDQLPQNKFHMNCSFLRSKSMNNKRTLPVKCYHTLFKIVLIDLSSFL